MPALVLPLDTRSVAAARRFLRTVLDGHTTSSTADAVLMISELATNGVRHARSQLGVMASVAEQTLRVEVSDDDPGLPVASDPAHHAISGRGLGIVESLADRWGITRNAGGKVVWFELHLRGGATGLP